MRAGGRADQVVGGLDVRDPVAQRLVHRVLQRAGARRDRIHLGAQKLHAKDVRLLPLDVGGAHVDDAGQAEARADGRGGDAVLARAGLGDDAGLAHAARQKDLAEAIVDLVRAGVIELVALEIDLCAAAPPGSSRHFSKMLRQALGVIERARPSGVVRVEMRELGLVGRVALRRLVGRLEVEDERHQRLGDEASAVQAEVAALVGAGAIGVRLRGDVHAARSPVGGGEPVVSRARHG